MKPPFVKPPRHRGDFRVTRNSRIGNRSLHRCLPDILHRLTVQQQAMSALIDVTSRTHGEVVEMREALQLPAVAGSWARTAHAAAVCPPPSAVAAGDDFDETPCHELIPADSQLGYTDPSMASAQALPPTVLRSLGQAAPGQERAPALSDTDVYDILLGKNPASSASENHMATAMSSAASCSAEELKLDGKEIDFAYEVGHEQSPPRHVVKFQICGQGRYLHELLDNFAMVVVSLNALFSWLQLNYEVDRVYTNTPAPSWVSALDTAFAAVFLVEVVVRCWMIGPRVFFITGSDKAWNHLDTVLVGSSLVDWLFTFADLSYIRAVRICRIMRAFRALRGMRFVRGLRLMLASIRAAVASFLWGSLLFAFVTFMAAVSVMQSLVVIIDTRSTELSDPVYELYGTVAQTMLTLFMSITGGRDWGELLQPLQEVSGIYTYFFTGYVMCMVFGVMNVLTAVFCEHASHIVSVDRDLVIQDEVNRAKEDHKRIKRCFVSADQDGDGKVSLEELETFLDSPERRAMLSIMAIDVTEARGLFELLDAESAGCVDVNTFVDAIMRLKGSAKGCDTAMLLYENKRLMIRIAGFMCYTCDSFKVLFRHLRAEGKELPLGEYLSPQVLKQKETDAKFAIRSNFASQLGGLPPSRHISSS